MKKTKLILNSLLVLSVCVGCSSANGVAMASPGHEYSYILNNGDNNQYLNFTENDFIETKTKNTSSFSLDSSTSSYSDIRRKITQHKNISQNEVMIEHMLNYFKYSYEAPKDEPLSLYTEVNECPWNNKHKLASIAVRARDYVKPDTNVPNNYVFLIDVSGSMYDYLYTVQESFKMLLENLDENDTVSIVTYASGVNIVLEGATCDQKSKIVAAIEDLEASGSTNGSGGIQLAYQVAQKYFVKDGNNRIILGTDGDFNVGISSINSLEKFISEKRKTGIYLSALGFGYTSTRHDVLETLASNGNGNSYYINTILDARKALIDEVGGLLETVAKDTKTQVTFNTNEVKSYRLLGYETKLLSDIEFDNDETDAGEIGAGHTTVAMYELEMNENYTGQDIFNVELRYKDPKENDLNKKSFNQAYIDINEATEDFMFQAAVVEFALILRDSKYKYDSSVEHVLNTLSSLNCVSNDDYKSDFKKLVSIYSDYSASLKR